MLALLAASIAEELAPIAEELAAIAEESAAEAAMLEELGDELMSAGGVTTTVDGVGIVVGAGVTTVSSFLPQAVNEIAAIIETNNSAFFILVPHSKRGSNHLPVIMGTLL